MNKYIQNIATRLETEIKDQAKWIADQRAVIDDMLLSNKKLCSRGFTLRQAIQAWNTGRQTYEILLSFFKEEIGISYKDYLSLKIEAENKEKQASKENIIEVELIKIMKNFSMGTSANKHIFIATA